MPYIVAVSTKSVVTAFQRHSKQHLLYAGAIAYMVWAGRQTEEQTTYLMKFMRSIMTKSIVLLAEQFVFGKIHKGDLALSFFYMSLILSAYILLRCSRSKLTDQCLAVLMYSLSSHLLQALQQYCDNQLMGSFAVTVSLVVVILYQSSLSQPATEFCVNSLSILWTQMATSMLDSFYGVWEPLFVYLLLFLGMQALRNTLAQVLHTTAVISKRSTEIVLLGTDPAVLETSAEAQDSPHDD